MKKNRGVTLLELTIAIALLGILMSVLWPILNFFIRVNNQYEYSVSTMSDVEIFENYLERNVANTNFANSFSSTSYYKANKGIIIGNINSSLEVLNNEQKFGINIDNSNFLYEGNKKIGNSIIIEEAILYNDKNNPGDLYNNKIVFPSYKLFRFLTYQDEKTKEIITVLTCATTYDSNDYSYNYIESLKNVNNVIPWINEIQVFPLNTSKIKLVPNQLEIRGSSIKENNYFEKVPGGIKVHYTYYPNPNNLSLKNVRETLFLIRGEL